MHYCLLAILSTIILSSTAKPTPQLVASNNNDLQTPDAFFEQFKKQLINIDDVFQPKDKDPLKFKKEMLAIQKKINKKVSSSSGSNQNKTKRATNVCGDLIVRSEIAEIYHPSRPCVEIDYVFIVIKSKEFFPWVRSDIVEMIANPKNLKAQIDVMNKAYNKNGFKFPKFARSKIIIIDDKDNTYANRDFNQDSLKALDHFKTKHLTLNKRLLKIVIKKPSTKDAKLSTIIRGISAFPNSADEHPESDYIIIHPFTFPNLDSKFFPNPTMLNIIKRRNGGGKTLVHEIGHWLGLFHPFEGDCSYPNDYIEDTLPMNHLEMSKTSCNKASMFSTDIIPDSNPPKSHREEFESFDKQIRDTKESKKDDTSNYMLYEKDKNMNSFTIGQAIWMHILWNEYRK